MSLPLPGTYLDIRQAPEIWGRGLVQHMALAFQVRIAFDSMADLLAAPSRGLTANDDAAPDLATVGGSTYAWSRFATAAHDGANIIRPSDVSASQEGRWVRQVLPHYANLVRSRYYQCVGYADARVPVFGPTDSGSLWDRCGGKVPALFISSLGDEPENASQTFAWHWFDATYRVRVLSANFRGGVAATFGGTAAEEIEDPGAARMIGDVRWYCVSTNGLVTRTATDGSVTHHRAGFLGLNEMQVGRRVLDMNRNERIVSDTMELKLRGSTWTPNEPGDLLDVKDIWVQQQNYLGSLVGDPFQVQV